LSGLKPTVPERIERRYLESRYADTVTHPVQVTEKLSTGNPGEGPPAPQSKFTDGSIRSIENPVAV